MSAIAMDNLRLPFDIQAPVIAFENSIVSKETRRQYKNKVGSFFDFLQIEGKDLNEKACMFVEEAADSNWATAAVIQFISHHRSRYDQQEITAGTSYHRIVGIKWRGLTD